MAAVDKTAFVACHFGDIILCDWFAGQLKAHGYDVVSYHSYGDELGDHLKHIEESAHFIVLLTSAVTLLKGLRSPLFRNVIEAAIDLRKNVVPLLFDDFDFASAIVNAQLTPKLAKLKDYQALRNFGSQGQSIRIADAADSTPRAGGHTPPCLANTRAQVVKPAAACRSPCAPSSRDPALNKEHCAGRDDTGL